MTKRYRKQEAPLSLSFELSMGCNLRCDFCGIAAIQEKQGHGYKFMDPKVMQSAMEQVKELGWNSRIGYAMRGDPTQHPDYAGMVAIATELRPKSTKLMLTNAGGLLRKPGAVANIKSLFDAGLNLLGLDHYQGVGYVPKVLDALRKEFGGLESDGAVTPHGYEFWEYPMQAKRINPHQRYPRAKRALIEIRDIAWTEKTDKKGNHNRLSNHAGSGAPPNNRMIDKRCALPFRQLAIHHDGSVAVCCNDWRGEYHCGNIMKEGIEAIWNGPAFGAAREALYAGRRDMLKPCDGCDHRSFRNGLLPDITAKGTLPRPGKYTAADIALATKKGPREKVFARPWDGAK